jgi:hypothetical protein
MNDLIVESVAVGLSNSLDSKLVLGEFDKPKTLGSLLPIDQ